ncbi:MAG TPA: hypothetical protein ENJ20_06430 [Bacteroidetes bacterium]|nr:hypothetical protein [Bacteroidota bacterium]
MKLSNYFFNLIRSTDGLSPDQIKSNLQAQPRKTFHLVADGFAPSFLSSVLFFPNAEILFTKKDDFTFEEEKEFIKKHNDNGRRRLLFISRGYSIHDIDTLLRLKISMFLWDKAGALNRPSDLIKWATAHKGRVFLAATGYTPLVLKLSLRSPLQVFIRKNDFQLPIIRELTDKGKNRIFIIADDFSQNTLNDLKNRGANILRRE